MPLDPSDRLVRDDSQPSSLGRCAAAPVPVKARASVQAPPSPIALCDRSRRSRLPLAAAAG
eukprot:scaffold90658_cov57-Phaeocystis_antarctica.AAC.1